MLPTTRAEHVLDPCALGTSVVLWFPFFSSRDKRCAAASSRKTAESGFTLAQVSTENASTKAPPDHVSSPRHGQAQRYHPLRATRLLHHHAEAPWGSSYSVRSLRAQNVLPALAQLSVADRRAERKHSLKAFQCRAVDARPSSGITLN